MEKFDENLKKEFYDERNGLWYELKGDYYYPMIAVPKQEKIIIGKYGRARLNYIKKYKQVLYTELMMAGTLNKHLAEIDKTLCRRNYIFRIYKCVGNVLNLISYFKNSGLAIFQSTI